jgi:hypothetical protein
MQMLRSGKTVPAICQAAEVSEEGRALLGADVAARQFVEQLLEQERYADAIAFLAHALPRREAVWWAWLCAREAAGEKAPPATLASLDATKAWIAEPTDANRRAAFAAAEAAGVATATGCAGLAAFLSGDTLGPPGAPPAPPEEYAGSKAIGGSINLAAVADGTIDIPARYAEFVRRGLELADRVQLWSADADVKTAR